MIRSPLGFRINPDPDRSIRDQVRQAAQIGTRGVILDAAGPIAPDRLSETGRRDLRHTLRSVELSLIALNLPTRRPFDTTDQLDDRLNRADRAFALAFDLGARLILIRVGAVPAEADAPRLETFRHALGELAIRADRRGVRLALETGAEPGATLRGFLDGLGAPSLAASLDPAGLLHAGIDPVATTRELGPWVAHAYARDAAGTPGRFGQNPHGAGFPPGALDWEEYLGALEEIDYRGFLTIWPDPHGDQAAEFARIAGRLQRY